MLIHMFILIFIYLFLHTYIYNIILKHINRLVRYGVIPLRGVIRNVRPAKINAKTLKDFLKNAELAAINKVLSSSEPPEFHSRFRPGECQNWLYTWLTSPPENKSVDSRENWVT